jgi:CBS domain-containing protein
METHFRSPTEITAAQVMTSPAIACREETRLEELAEILADYRISGVAVVDADDRLVGLVSERDIAHALGGPLLRLVIRRPAREGDSDRRIPMENAHLARDVMSSPPVVGHPHTTIRALAHAMSEKQVNRIPIVDEDRLVGMVSRGDLLRAIGGLTLHSRPEVEKPVVVGAGIAGSTVSHPDD